MAGPKSHGLCDHGDGGCAPADRRRRVPLAERRRLRRPTAIGGPFDLGTATASRSPTVIFAARIQLPGSTSATRSARMSVPPLSTRSPMPWTNLAPRRAGATAVHYGRSGPRHARGGKAIRRLPSALACHRADRHPRGDRESRQGLPHVYYAEHRTGPGCERLFDGPLRYCI